MFGFGKNAEVVELFPSAPSGADATILDGISRFNQKRLNQKRCHNRWETIDLWGRVGSSLGYKVRNEGGGANFAKRRVLVGAAALTLVATTMVGAVTEIKSLRGPTENSQPGEEYLDLPVVNGSKDIGTLVTQVDSDTFYEQAGNVLCTFSGKQAVIANADTTASDMVNITKGIGFTLNYGSDCYQSALAHTQELNPQGFTLTVHNSNTGLTTANTVYFPEEVAVKPAN